MDLRDCGTEARPGGLVNSTDLRFRRRGDIQLGYAEPLNDDHHVIAIWAGHEFFDRQIISRDTSAVQVDRLDS